MPELITLYRTISWRDSSIVFKEIKEIENLYNQKRSLKGREDLYYEKRDRYNKLINSDFLKKEGKLELACLFLFLNKTCFNGVYRKNPEGIFNVPHGKRSSTSQAISILEKKDKDSINVLIELSSSLKKAEIQNKDYREVLEKAEPGDFVYLDPPYVKTVNYYGIDSFDIDKSRELKQEIDKLDKKKVKFLLSNSNLKLTKDIFLKKKYSIKQVNATRTMNRRTYNKSSNKPNEILIANFALK